MAFRPAPSHSLTSEERFHKAESSYKALKHSPSKKKLRAEWLRCIASFQDVHRFDPEGKWAPVGLFMSGKLYNELFRISRRPSDKKEAIDIFERIILRYPESLYVPRAKMALRTLAPAEKKEIALIPAKREPPQREREPSPPPERGPETAEKKETIPGTCRVTGLRVWSNPEYTRIVIDADGETSFTHRLLKEDPAINKPQRLYVDLQNSRLSKDIQKVIPINDNLLSDARAGQYTLDSVRVVVDIKSIGNYNVFSLSNPFRIVIDVLGSGHEPLPDERGVRPHREKESPSVSIAKQLALGVRRIVIDPGHGGRDFGAPGYLTGVHEKDITLQIAKRLGKKIRETLGLEVILTRTVDRYLTLEERTAIANTRNADLFISIHTNASRNRNAIGIETYFLNLATDNEAIEVAARENATSTKNISDLHSILNDLMKNAKISESSRFAGYIQESLYTHLKPRYNRIVNKGVKQAPFYVLLGARMPAVLIETSFISNRMECERLIDSKYQDDLCDAIIEGIRGYMREINPSAFSAPGFFREIRDSG